jgi:hypothetical protein
MRTTLTLDDDVAVLLREEAERSRRPFKAVVNQAIRLGLRSVGAASVARPFRVQPHAFVFKAGVDLDKLNQLADELEVETLVRSLKRQEREA